ncbi:MAG: hypothetical protein ACR65R_07485 [Methylomicrobium sp.]
MNAKKLILIATVFSASLASHGANAGPFGLPDINVMQQVFGCDTGARCAARAGVITHEQARFADQQHARWGAPLNRFVPRFEGRGRFNSQQPRPWVQSIR